MLSEARRLVGRGWCQGVSAATVDGSPTAPWSPQAACWSAAGAFIAVWESYRPDEQRGGPYLAAFQDAQLALVTVTQEPLKDWNDAPGRSKDEVLAAFTHAIKLTVSAQATDRSGDDA
jgi:hypothetical protein